MNGGLRIAAPGVQAPLELRISRFGDDVVLNTETLDDLGEPWDFALCIGSEPGGRVELCDLLSEEETDEQSSAPPRSARWRETVPALDGDDAHVSFRSVETGGFLRHSSSEIFAQTDTGPPFDEDASWIAEPVGVLATCEDASGAPAFCTCPGGALGASDCHTPRSCAEHQELAPNAESGLYVIDPDGDDVGVVTECDMSFDGGGWTLLVSSARTGPQFLTAGEPRTGAARFMAVDDARAVANVSRQVHLRTAGSAADRSATSLPDSSAIERLRAGQILSFPGVEPSEWSGPMRGSLVQSGCTGSPSSYPDVFHACGNFGGLHFLGDSSAWVFQGQPEDIQLWVR